MRRLLLATLALASAVPTAHASNEWFEPGTAVLITVSHGFEDMFRNWWYWYAKLDLNMEVLLLAEDEPTRSAFAAHTSHVRSLAAVARARAASM